MRLEIRINVNTCTGNNIQQVTLWTNFVNITCMLTIGGVSF